MKDIQSVAKAHARVLKTFLSEYGIELAHSQALEAASRLAGFKNWATLVATPEPLSDAQPTAVPATPLVEDEKLMEAVCEGVAEGLGSALDCHRVWAAWGCNTMSERDFSEVADDSERVHEIAAAAVSALEKALRARQDVAPQPLATQEQGNLFEKTRRQAVVDVAVSMDQRHFAVLHELAQAQAMTPSQVLNQALRLYQREQLQLASAAANLRKAPASEEVLAASIARKSPTFSSVFSDTGGHSEEFLLQQLEKAPDTDQPAGEYLLIMLPGVGLNSPYHEMSCKEVLVRLRPDVAGTPEDIAWRRLCSAVFGAKAVPAREPVMDLLKSTAEAAHTSDVLAKLALLKSIPGVPYVWEGPYDRMSCAELYTALTDLLAQEVIAVRRTRDAWKGVFRRVFEEDIGAPPKDVLKTLSDVFIKPLTSRFTRESLAQDVLRARYGERVRLKDHVRELSCYALFVKLRQDFTADYRLMYEPI